MAEEFVGFEIAVIVVTASIVLAGIMFGVGRAFSYKRIEHFGIEELVQSVINAAIIGSFAIVIELISSVSSSVITESCEGDDVVQQLICVLQSTNASLFVLFQETAKTLNLLGYYQSLSLDFGAFLIAPFDNLSSISSILSSNLLTLNIIMLLVDLNMHITSFIGQNALALLFPVGLVLRTLFATRKVGGFLIALSIGLFVFYPAFVLIFPDPTPNIQNATLEMEYFNNNSFYASMPVVDLNDNYAIAGKIDVMSGRCTDHNFSNTSACEQIFIEQNITNITQTQNLSTDFSGDLTVISQKNTQAISGSILYAVIAPLFSLMITVVFVKELADILGSEVGIKSVSAI